MFIFLCISFFLYQAFKCINSYINQTPFSQISVENQELYPLPSVCFGPFGIGDTRPHNLTANGYRKKGIWKSVLPDFDEEQTYNNLSASFEDLVEKIQIDREIYDGSDAYERIVLSSTDHTIQLERCDYYFALKCFCLIFSQKQISFGIQQIRVFMRRDSVISIIAPQNLHHMSG